MAQGPLSLLDLEGMFQNLVNSMLAFAGLASFALILAGGIRYLMSNGDDKAVQDAKKTLTYAIVGLLVVTGSFAFFNTLLGDKILDFPSPNPDKRIRFDIPHK